MTTPGDRTTPRSLPQSAKLADVLYEIRGPVNAEAQRMEAATGDPLRIAAVVRDLIRRREERGMSLAERDLLREASAPLLAEIALATDASEEKAKLVLFKLVMEGDAEVLAHVDDLEVTAA